MAEIPSTNDSKFYYIFTSSPDSSGILEKLFSTINGLGSGGDILQFRQDLQHRKNSKTPLANIHLIAEWVHGTKEIPEKKAIEKEIERVFRFMYQNKEIILDEDALIIKAEKRTPDQFELDLAKFKIYFTDRRGIAEEVFSVFSQKGISVIESIYNRKTKDSGDIGTIILYANVTDMGYDKIIELENDVFKITEILDITVTLNNGTYSF